MVNIGNEASGHRHLRRQGAAILGASAIAIGAALIAGSAQAAPTVAGSDDCPVVDGVATCEGDLTDGVSNEQALGHPAVSAVIVRNVSGPIAPAGTYGIGLIRGDVDLTLGVADGVVITTYDDPAKAGFSQGILAYAQGGHHLTVDSGADITATGGNGPGVGIEAAASGAGGSIALINRGDISVSSNLRTTAALLANAFDGADGDISVVNSGDLDVDVAGAGERDALIGGIVAIGYEGKAAIDVRNSGAISLRTDPAAIDDDFAGIASAIVTNGLGTGTTTTIVNSGAIDAIGGANYGITGYGNGDGDGGTSVAIDNSGAIAMDGRASTGIMAQATGGGVDLSVLNRAEGAISIANANGTTAILVDQASTRGSASVVNQAAIAVSGPGSARAIGITTAGANATGTYDLGIENSGDLTLSTPFALGITASATRDDTAKANIVNSGTIDLSASTEAGSRGIAVLLDGAGSGDGATSATIDNSGDIRAGTGTAIAARADALTITNGGALTTTGAASDVVTLGGGGAAVSFTTTGDIGATGAGSSAIAIFRDSGLSALNGTTITIEDSARVTSADASAIRDESSGSHTYVHIRAGGVVESAADTAIRFTGPSDQYVRVAGRVTGGNGKAIEFGSTGAARLTLADGGVIDGTVSAPGSNDLLELNIEKSFLDTPFNFDLDRIGTQYEGFERFTISGYGRVNLSGTANMPGLVRLGSLLGSSLQVALDDATLTSPDLIEATYLRGNGTISDLSALTISPGLDDGDIGTLHTGAVSLRQLIADVASAGEHDRLVATGAVNLDAATIHVRPVGSLAESSDPFDIVLLANDGAGAIGGSVDYILEDLPFLNVKAELAGGDGNDVVLRFTAIPVGDPDVVDGCSPGGENNVVAWCGGIVQGADAEAAVGNSGLRSVTLTVKPDTIITPGKDSITGIELGNAAHIITEAGSRVNGQVYTYGSDWTLDLGGDIVTTRGVGVSVQSALGGDPFGAADPAMLVRLRESGSIETGGASASGISMLLREGRSGEHRVAVDGAIRTAGSNAHGVTVGAATIGRIRSLIDVGGSIETGGDGAHGIRGTISRTSSGSVPPTLPDPREVFTITLTGGRIATGGAGAHGIYLDLQANRNEAAITLEPRASIAANGVGSSAIYFAQRPESFTTSDPGGTADSVATAARVTVGASASVTAAGAPAIFVADGGEANRGYALDLLIAGSIATDPASAAVLLGATDDRVTLAPGYAVTGIVDAAGGADRLVLGGEGGAGSFDVSAIGGAGQFRRFESFAKDGASAWTLTGASDGIATFAVDGGTLIADAAMADTAFAVADGAVLGGTGTLGGVTVAAGGTIAPGNSPGTLTMGSLALDRGATLAFDLGTPDTVGGDNDLIVVTGGLTLDGTLDVTAAPQFGNGLYTLIRYGNLVADNGLQAGNVPDGYSYDVSAGAVGRAGHVTMLVSSAAAGGNQFWDGADTTPGGTANGRGGTGDWTTGGTNWTNQAGDANAAWGGEFAIFGGTAGTVSVMGETPFTGMQFLTDGYEISNGSLGARLVASASGATINLGADIGARIGTNFTGGPITKTGAGTLTVGGRITDDIGAVETWTVEGGELRIDGGFAAGSWADDTALILRGGSTLRVTEFGVIGVGGNGGFTAAELDGRGHVVIEQGGLVTGTLTGSASDSTITIAGTLESNNAGYRPILLSGSSNTITVASTGKIETTGNVNTAIRMTGGSTNNVITVDGLVKTHNSGSAGIELAGNGNEVSVRSGGRIETSGGLESNQYTPGIWVRGNDGKIDVAGTVSTEGFNAVGVWTSGDNNSITVSGTISTTADFNTGRPDRTNPSAILMEGGSNTLVLSGTASTAGADVPTVVLAGVSSAMTLSGKVLAASDSETAILFDGGSIASRNRLELQPGYKITGLVVGDAAAAGNELIFGGGSGSGMFDVSAIGDTAQFRNFGPAKGVFFKSGNSTWTLTGTNDAAYPGTFRLQGGTLLVEGSMAGTGFSNLDNAATLGGTGTVGSIEMLNGGTVAPGSAAIGTLNVAGDVLFGAGSTFAVEIAGDGTGDRLAAGGAATLDGGTVSVTALDPETSYQHGQSYTILTAAGGVTGAFDAAVSQSIFLTPTLDYGDANAVRLVVALAGGTDPTEPVVFARVAETFNQRQAAGALDAFDQTPGSNALAAYNAIVGASTSEAAARTIFDHASGEIYATMLGGAARGGIGRTRALTARSSRALSDGWGFWIGGGYDKVDHDADGNASAAATRGLSADIGIDYRGGGNRWAVGFGGGYLDGRTRIDRLTSQASYRGWHIGGYARYGGDGPGLGLTGAIDYARLHNDVDRRIDPLGRQASSRIDQSVFAATAHIRYGFDLSGGWTAGPLASIDHAATSLPHFAERGADSLNLSSAGDDDFSLTRFGAGSFVRWSGAAGRFEASAEYVDGKRRVPAAGLRFAGAAGSPFAVHGPSFDPKGVMLGLSGDFALGSAWSIGGRFGANLLDDGNSFDGSVTLTFAF